MTFVTRVGIGTDLHRLVPGRPLVLAHVPIEFDRGLAGHSDGDVVLHAVIDALLGAAGLPDIGERFPDTDPQYKDADSSELLADALVVVRSTGFMPINADVIIHAEKPKLSPYKPAMRSELARLLGLDIESVGIKAKTGEGLGAVGGGDAIACTAIVSLGSADKP